MVSLQTNSDESHACSVEKYVLTLIFSIDCGPFLCAHSCMLESRSIGYFLVSLCHPASQRFSWLL